MGLQRTSVLAAIGLFAALGVSTPSNAAMLAYQTFNGADLSIDPFGPKGGSGLSAHVPVGSQVLGAWIYRKGSDASGGGSLNGTGLSFGALGGSNPPDYVRADVTPIVKAPIESDSDGMIDIPYVDGDNSDDEILVVVTTGNKNVVVLAGGCTIEGTICTDGTGEVAEVVPEPATLTLFGAGLLGLGAIRRRLKKA